MPWSRLRSFDIVFAQLRQSLPSSLPDICLDHPDSGNCLPNFLVREANDFWTASNRRGSPAEKQCDRGDQRAWATHTGSKGMNVDHKTDREHPRKTVSTKKTNPNPRPIRTRFNIVRRMGIRSPTLVPGEIRRREGLKVQKETVSQRSLHAREAPRRKYLRHTGSHRSQRKGKISNPYKEETKRRDPPSVRSSIAYLTTLG